MKKLFFLASALLCGVISASAVDYLVQTGKEGDGKWAPEAISALGVAAENVIDLSKEGATLPTTGEIWFAAGTYEFSATYNIGNSAKLYGGFAGTETEINTDLKERELAGSGKPYDFKYSTIFSVKQPTGESGTPVKLFPDARTEIILNGLTIQNSISSANGGVCRLGNKSKVERCKILNNSAKETTGQGGAFQSYNGEATYTNSYFEGNTAGQGGAIYTNSQSQKLTVTNCIFKNNTATGTSNAGGAIHAQNGCAAEITNCVFTSNAATAAGQGGALSLANTSAATLVANNVFTGNVANDVEGALKAVILLTAGNFYFNTIIESTGTAIWAKAGNVMNNVFWATAEVVADAQAKARCSLDKSVVYTNNAGLNTWGDGADVSNILLEPANTGNEEGKLYPVFADPENGDFNIGKGSALIGKGVAIEGITTDIEGVTRTSLDLGAYAYVEGKVPTAFENTEKAPLDIQAALQAGEVYNLLGQRVGELQAGNIYIVGGQKVLMQ